MRDRPLNAIVGVVVFAAMMVGASIELQAMRDRMYPPRPLDEDSLYIQSGPMLRRLTVAYNALAADLYWIRAIQYYGDGKRRLASNARVPDPPPMIAAATSDAYSLMYPLLDLTTSLDPRFNIAYRFGAVFLAEAYPAGPGRPDLAVKLLEKGLRERPDKWEYMEDIGFVHYWYEHDYRAAAEWFRKASQAPGAPWWLQSLAATTLVQGGDRQSSRVMWEAILESSEVGWQRQDAERRLLQLRALDQIDDLQGKIDSYARRSGAPVPDWFTLIRAGIFPGVPFDPTGALYALDGGRVTVAQSSRLWPLPQEPERADGRPPS
jgi:tetratricopeptide (TPR) repeat protein